MPETFDTLLSEIAETAGSAVHPAGPFVARLRGHQRAVRRRVAVSVSLVSVVLFGGVGWLVSGLVPSNPSAPASTGHSSTPTPSPSGASPSPSASGSIAAPNGRTSASAPPSATAGSLDTVVPGAWTPASQFPFSWLAWKANMSQPAIHTADRQWFYSCFGSGTLAHLGASGYQEVSYGATLPGTQSSDYADQVLFFFPSTSGAAQALGTIQNDYAHCPEQTAGTNGAAITGTVRQTEELDGSYAWLHTYQGVDGAPALPADIPAENHEFFVQRGDVVEMVWFGGTDVTVAGQNSDLDFLNSLNASLCVYGGTCPAGAHPLTATITASGSTALALGGSPVEVQITITNNSDDTLHNLAPIVSLGHCTCVNTPAPEMPNGELQLWDTSSAAWKTLFYDAEGSGTDYVSSAGINQVPGFDLSAGQSVSFKYRVRLNPASEQPKLTAPYRLSNGTSSIDLTVIHPGSGSSSGGASSGGASSNTVIGTSPTMTVPVTVTVD